MTKQPKPFDGYSSFEDWLDVTRAKIWEQVKDLNDEDFIRYFDEKTEQVIKEFGLKVSNLTPVIPHKRERASAV